MSFYKEQEIKTPRIHINIRLYNKTQKQQYLNKRVFRISGAVKNNIPGVEHICPNSKMLWFKLINTFFLTKVDLGLVELLETLILEKRLFRTSIFNEYNSTNQSNPLIKIAVV